MTPDTIALGRRAHAAGFRLVPGCLIAYGARTHISTRLMEAALSGWDEVIDPCVLGRESEVRDVPHDAVPDFTDPTGCTQGALLAQVREAVGAPVSTQLWLDGGWRVVTETPHGPSVWAEGPCEVSALVAALEAAPKRGGDDG